MPIYDIVCDHCEASREDQYMKPGETMACPECVTGTLRQALGSFSHAMVTKGGNWMHFNTNHPRTKGSLNRIKKVEHDWS